MGQLSERSIVALHFLANRVLISYSIGGLCSCKCRYNVFSLCADMDLPKIKCPSVKDKWAEPGKLTARVTWDTPEGVDTADGILTESVSSPTPFKLFSSLLECVKVLSVIPL